MIADVAVVFGWPLAELREMTVEELLEWRRMAKERVEVKGLKHG